MLIASTESRIHSNLLFLMADIMEMLMTDVREMFRAEGFELKHEAKRNFNTALKALKNLRHGCIETCSMSTQEDFANDADNMYETIKLIIDRCGENDDKLFRFYEYIKSFPSECGMQRLDDSVFDFMKKKKDEKKTDKITTSDAKVA